MTGSGPRPALAAALLAGLLLGGCAGSKPPEGFRAERLGDDPPEFRDARTVLVRLARRREAGDAAGARAMHPRVLAAARDLLKMAPPHDLRRDRVPRFLEGRASFGDAVNAFDRAVQAADDATLWQATRDLEATFFGWHDAYRGIASEGAV